VRPPTKKAHGRQDAVGSGTPARLFVIATERAHNALCAMAGNRTGNHPHPVISLRPRKIADAFCTVGRGQQFHPVGDRFQFTLMLNEMQD
jgi:hypothetical protein